MLNFTFQVIKVHDYLGKKDISFLFTICRTSIHRFAKTSSAFGKWFGRILPFTRKTKQQLFHVSEFSLQIVLHFGIFLPLESHFCFLQDGDSKNSFETILKKTSNKPFVMFFQCSYFKNYASKTHIRT